jgi:hypothetical protein
MRIMTLYPAVDLPVVWKNFGSAILPDRVRSMWYRVIYDVLPISVRMYRIYLCDKDRCSQCDAQDTLLHHLTECDSLQFGVDTADCALSHIQRLATFSQLHTGHGLSTRKLCGFWRPWFTTWFLPLGAYQ